MAASKTVRVGNAGGYWGDDPGAMSRQLASGPLDYLTQDFLAEITMSILQKQKARNPSLGYANDFLDQLRSSLGVWDPRTCIISNAGGINPLSCAEQVEKICREAGLNRKIAVVDGDDLMGRLEELSRQGDQLKNMETGESFSSVRTRVLSANAYLGAKPVVEALRGGASLVVTGRVTDTAIVAAAPVYEFGWDLDDWDRLASAVVAGHILECGAQATGGNLVDWQSVANFNEMSYPIAEFSQDGSFVVTKHAGGGGQVTAESVVSQLVYEMGDPVRYITPDVVADFTSIDLQEVGRDRVRISGVRGRPRTDSLKVSVSYQDGYKAHGTLIVSCPEAVAKCQKIAETLWERLDIKYEQTRTDLIGYDAAHQHLAPSTDPPEILLRLGVRDPDREKVEKFSETFASLILSTVSGVAIVGARPRIQEVVAYWPCLIPAEKVTPQVTFLDSGSRVSVPWKQPAEKSARPSAPSPVAPLSTAESSALKKSSTLKKTRLIDLCYGRSGDKGDTCNIGIVARSEPAYQWITEHLTAERVKEYFGKICEGKVERYLVPNLRALNFLLHQSLGGGGTVSLSIDPQGKTYADALLRMVIEVPEQILSSVADPDTGLGGEQL